MPIYLRPVGSAAAQELPLPAKGSRTLSPGRVKLRINGTRAAVHHFLPYGWDVRRITRQRVQYIRSQTGYSHNPFNQNQLYTLRILEVDVRTIDIGYEHDRHIFKTVRRLWG
jgi:hypothetical protein